MRECRFTLKRKRNSNYSLDFHVVSQKSAVRARQDKCIGNAPPVKSQGEKAAPRPLPATFGDPSIPSRPAWVQTYRLHRCHCLDPLHRQELLQWAWRCQASGSGWSCFAVALMPCARRRRWISLHRSNPSWNSLCGCHWSVWMLSCTCQDCLPPPDRQCPAEHCPPAPRLRLTKTMQHYSGCCT